MTRIWEHLMLIIFLWIGVSPDTYSQASYTKQDESVEDIYTVNYWVASGVIVLGAAGNIFGQERILNKDAIPLSRINRLDKSGVPGIDRISLRLNTANYKLAKRNSDFLLNVSPFLPAFIFLDKKVRSDALDVLLVYVESQLVVTNVYAWTFLGPTLVERIRPISYYDELPIEDREWGGNRNSFYSGHVSTIATSTFFMAKTMTDIHPELGWKKWLVYGAAAIPPTYMGIKRIQALKHFPTDIFTGFVIGVAGGILVPALHTSNKKKKKRKLSVNMLYERDLKWAGITLHF